MTLEAAITEAVRQAVRQEVEPLRRELLAIRQERDAEGVSPAEAAKRLGLSVRTVNRRIRDGLLPSIRVGGARRVLLSGTLSAEAQVVSLAERARSE